MLAASNVTGRERVSAECAGVLGVEACSLNRGDTPPPRNIPRPVKRILYSQIPPDIELVGVDGRRRWCQSFVFRESTMSETVINLRNSRSDRFDLFAEKQQEQLVLFHVEMISPGGFLEIMA